MSTATGLRTMETIAHKAWVDHMVDNGLAAPHTITLDAEGLRLSVRTADAEAWGASIHTDDIAERPALIDGLTHVTVHGRLPLLGVKVQLRFIRCDHTGRHLSTVAG